MEAVGVVVVLGVAEVTVGPCDGAWTLFAPPLLPGVTVVVVTDDEVAVVGVLGCVLIVSQRLKSASDPERFTCDPFAAGQN